MEYDVKDFGAGQKIVDFGKHRPTLAELNEIAAKEFSNADPRDLRVFVHMQGDREIVFGNPKFLDFHNILKVRVRKPNATS